MGQPPGCLTNVGPVSLCFKLPGVVSVWCDSITFLLPLHPADNHFHGNKAHSSCDEVFSGLKLWANTPKIQISDLSKPKLSQWYSNGATNHPTQQLRVTPSAPQSFLVSCLVSASAAARSTSVRGQKWLRSPTGRLSGRRISAAMMMNVMYHPSIATTKMSAPPAWFIISLTRYVRGY